MKIQFKTNRLENAYRNSGVAERTWGRSVARKFIQRIDFILSASGIEQLRGYRSLRFHALRGDRAGMFGIDLTGNMRLVVSVSEEDNLTIILEVVDSHD
ncbi:MAG: type II toxin-antitoxin system RelE/ParE family toxin [Chloroflexi bacterium]|nr:type II toxin-antitoxin system RelE/ParE family toxin [Chloroflexota bacterium]